MNRSVKLQWLFFVLMAVLLVRVALAIQPRSRAETAPICSADAPARAAQGARPLPP